MDMERSVGGINIHLSTGVVVVLLLCLGSLGYLAHDYHEQVSVLDDAEEVEATVMDVGIEEEGRRGTRYRPSVEYEYEYDGSTHTSDNVFPGSFERTYDTEAEAREVLEPHTEGQVTTAYVDPSDPETAFLERETTNQPIWYGGIVAFVLVLTGLHAIGPRDVGRVDLEPAERVENQRYETLFGFDRNAVRTSSKRYVRRSLLAFFALIPVGLFMFGLGVGSELSAAVVLGGFVLGYVGLTASTFAYTVWSFTEYRRLRDRIPEPRPPSPFRHPSRLVTILEWSIRTDEAGAYGNRIKWTALAGGLCVLLVFLVLVRA